MEHSNFLPQGATYRDIPSTCPKEFRDRIAKLRSEPYPLAGTDEKWRQEQLDKCARVARECTAQDATSSRTQAEPPVSRQHTVSAESRDKLLQWGTLRAKIFAVELRYSEDQPRDEKGRFAGTGGGEKANDAPSHAAAAKAHMDQADKYDESTDSQSQAKAHAHFQAAAAHLQASDVHSSKVASSVQKSQASASAQKASKYANGL